MSQTTYLSKCAKLKQGQLKMQRYKYCHTISLGTRYTEQGEKCLEKSRELALKMKAHARECRVCSVNDVNFYGLDHWPW